MAERCRTLGDELSCQRSLVWLRWQEVEVDFCCLVGFGPELTLLVVGGVIGCELSEKAA